MKVLGVGCIFLGLLAGCSPGGDPTGLPPTATTYPTPVGSGAPTDPAPADAGIPTLIYVKGATLRSFDPNTGNDDVIFELPSADVALSLDATRFAVVRDIQPGGDPEGFGEPEIMVGAVGALPETLGPGRSPLFSPEGDRLAAITEEAVVIYDLGTGESRVVLEGGGWSLIGWSGDEIAAAGSSGVALAGEGEPRFLRQAASGVWGVSPATPEFLVVGRDGSQLIDLDVDGGTQVEGSGRWADGAWSPDGSTVAAAVLKRGPIELTLLDTATGETTVVSDSRGAQGGVVWSADSQWFAYVRVDPENALDLQAVVCTIELECDPAFTWGRGVALLGLRS